MVGHGTFPGTEGVMTGHKEKKRDAKGKKRRQEYDEMVSIRRKS